MAHNARHDRILEILARCGEAAVGELAREFRVNEVTIRRDLKALESRGLLRRTHGGAVFSRADSVAFAFEHRRQMHLQAKDAIARSVAEQIAPGATISLDTGSTTLQVARHLAGKAGLKVLTSSLAVASALYMHENVEVILLGGQVRRGSGNLGGIITEDNLRRFRVELGIVGADACGPDGLYTTDVGVARVSQAMLFGAQRSILVADSSKFVSTAFVQFAGWDDIDEVVTDDGISASSREWLRGIAPAVTYVTVDATSGR